MDNKAYIRNLLHNKIKELSNEENNAFIIKGIPLDIIEFKNEINIEILLDNKLKYFNSVYDKRNIFTYEEFLLLNGIITEQYDKIYIINNNLYSIEVKNTSSPFLNTLASKVCILKSPNLSTFLLSL